MDWLSHLTDAPFANILFLAGLGFLAIGVFGKIVGKIEPDKAGRVMSGLVGVILTVMGFYLHNQGDRTRQVERGQPATAASTPVPKPETGGSSQPATAAGTPVPKPETGDFIRLTQLTPKLGTHLNRGQEIPFAIDLVYNLESAESALLSISTAQYYASGGGCQGNGELVDAIEVPVVRGKHQITASLNWSGDTGLKSKGRIFYQGYLGFSPMFWATSNGSRGERIKAFGTDPNFCYAFGP